MHTGREFMVRFWANVKSLFNTHTTNKNNPHGVTKSQIGLANVENKSSATIRGEMTSDNVTDALGYTPLDAAKKGAASGVAELDATGKVPSAQLPSYVDDTIEGYLSGGKFYKESSHTTQITGEAGKIYVELSTNKTYRWSGSTYVEISQSLALGETSTTAYRGDRGKAAYDHISNKSNPHSVTKSQVGLGNVPNVATNDQTPTFTAVNEDTALVSGEKLSSILGKIARTILTVISLKNTVDELNSNLDNLIKTQSFAGYVNLPSKGEGNVDMGRLNIPTGYTYIGVISKDSDYGDQFLCSFQRYGDHIYVVVRNTFAGTLTGDVSCTALFLKN
ncbi:hypothetical protein [Eubacterium sp. An3]|uniref:hypothetical protein n=1 Tax=Eubacterium sp. An3 TaxID=1965628 RepID=UPI000B55FA5E|nr:hypothetical protein [Eubacterium sp. An3]OUO26025.1 hypothetical protein B5F87_15800 [Eubacterium sp. An3]